MDKPKTISFVATAELEAALRKWAADDARSVSSMLRQILVQEAQRRQAQQQQQQRQPAAMGERG